MQYIVGSMQFLAISQRLSAISNLPIRIIARFACFFSFFHFSLTPSYAVPLSHWERGKIRRNVVLGCGVRGDISTQYLSPLMRDH
jgi:hypothetical protein